MYLVVLLEARPFKCLGTWSLKGYKGQRYYTGYMSAHKEDELMIGMLPLRMYVYIYIMN